MKKFIDTINAIPSKRLYQSIIADYNTNKAITELIDNPLDLWIKGDKKKSLKIEIGIDTEQQYIYIKDNAGGIAKEEFAFIVAPGHTTNNDDTNTIGIFGVGSKRAVVALAQKVSIKTGLLNSKINFQVEFDDIWLKTQDDWTLPVYEVDSEVQGGTLVELLKPRTPITELKIASLKEHLQSTYAKFLNSPNVSITLNGTPLTPITYENWAFPPGFEPREYSGILSTSDGSEVSVHVLAGLTLQSNAPDDEYGMYFYCNDRLVAKAQKTFEVGFSSGHAGKPHFNISLARVIVSLSGKPSLMPWNSSKSNINTDHEVFLALREWLITIMKDYASLSRRFQGHWENEVFKYTSGDTVKVGIEDLPKANTSHLPPLPISKPRYSDIIKEKNKTVVNKKPWVKGAYESIIAVDLIFKQHLDQKNRIVLILLDSNLEIAFKDFLVNDSGHYYTDSELLKIFSKRHLVEVEIKKYILFSHAIWKKVNYYNKMRNELIHKRSSVSLPDSEIEDFRSIVQKILGKMFQLKF